MEQDIKEVCDKLNINFDKFSVKSYKIKNKKRSYPIYIFYDDETKKIVYNKFKHEIDYWNYNIIL